MFKEVLYWIVQQITALHDWISGWNDGFEVSLTDKELHFLVIGLVGMGMIFVLFPLFKWLAKRDHVLVIAWLYVFTVILVITFAIEIGQRLTGTGDMEFADIVFGVAGFVLFFAIFASVRGFIKAMAKWIRSRKAEKNEETEITQPEQAAIPVPAQPTKTIPASVPAQPVFVEVTLDSDYVPRHGRKVGNDQIANF